MALLVVVAGGRAWAENQASPSAQLCTLASAGVGQPGSVVCLDAASGATSQSVAVGAIAAAAGGIAGSLVRHGGQVLVTNQGQGAVLFQLAGGQLQAPVTLDTDGEASFSGALGERGAYVLTGTRLLFYPKGQTTAASSQPLLVGDGSAAQVVLAGGYAYVSEKTGSLEAFALGRGGVLRGGATPVTGIPAGAIVGITAVGDLVVAPIAHLASNPNQSTVPLVRGLAVVQIVPTKEVAACWAAHDDGEVCITNPGSMTISCGHVGRDAFTSYTSAAASPTGETVFDVDMQDKLVVVLGKDNGAPILISYQRARRDSDFLTDMRQLPVAAAVATGALILPALE